MEIKEMNVEYPSGFEDVVHMTKDEMEQHIRLMAALKMFELGKVSLGRAAELAGMVRTAFIDVCGRYRISIFNYPAGEIEREISQDLETARRQVKK